ncbi:MAG: AAA family ATPase [Caldilineaceae bacterium]
MSPAPPSPKHFVEADEINRATPRTQAALLECMGERQVMVDGVTRIRRAFGAGHPKPG